MVGGFTNLYANYKTSSWYKTYDPDTTTTRENAKACFPTGTQPAYSWLLAPKGGEMSSTTRITSTGTLTASAAQGINIESDLSGSGTISSASLALVTAMIAALTGSGSITTANMVGVVQMVSALTGSGAITGNLGLLAGMAAALAGVGSISAALRGTLSMEAAIYVNQSTATVNELVAGVWNAVAADYNTSGTMGQKLNGAGSAGDPWTTDLSAYNTADTAGLILKQAKAKAAAAAALSA
jgi:hypothetical protein